MQERLGSAGAAEPTAGRTAAPDRAGLLREAAQEWADAEDAYGNAVKELAEKWPDVGLVNPEDRTSPEWQAVRDAQQRRLAANDRLRAALAATGDSGGPLDLERLRTAMDAVVPESIPPFYWTNERLARAIAAESARLSSKGYDKADQYEPTDAEKLAYLTYDAQHPETRRYDKTDHAAREGVPEGDIQHYTVVTDAEGYDVNDPRQE